VEFYKDDEDGAGAIELECRGEWSAEWQNIFLKQASLHCLPSASCWNLKLVCRERQHEE
jgi:hypothetical protein